MAAFIPITGPVVANTFYVNNALAARDVAMTLPAVTPQATDIRAMGTMSLPIWPLVENMELSITKVGVDTGFRSMLTPEPTQLEARWVQTVTDANGATKEVGCKAFMKGSLGGIPGLGLEPANPSENDTTYNLTRYQLMVDGQEAFLIDRLAGICRINGKDYAESMNSML